MRRPLLLDLFCGAGGGAVGYHRAGFDVIGVDINPQPNYPFEFVQADAMEYLRGHGSWAATHAIHASPPCQRYTALTKGTNADSADGYPDLLPPTRTLLDATGIPYVIENVISAPMRRDLLLCGLNFGLRVFRHRQFEFGNWKIENSIAHPSHEGHRVAGWRHGVRHEGDMVAVYGNGGGKGSIEDWQDAMGIHWTDVRKEIAEAIPPAYTEWVGKQLLASL